MATTMAEDPQRAITVRQVGLEEPWVWLAKGWRDLWRRPALSLGYGFVVAAVGALLMAGLFEADMVSVALPLASGFLLLGPMVAVGLYEMSRRYEQGEAFSPGEAVFVATRSPTQLAFVGAVLALFMLAWLRVAMLLFALFHGSAPLPPLDAWIYELLFTVDGLMFLTVGTLVGGVLAAIAFAISAVSVPLLMVRDVDAVTAILTSVRAVRENPKPLLLWAWLIFLLTAFGLATLFVGLIVTFPLVGHATWHAFRATVDAG